MMISVEKHTPNVQVITITGRLDAFTVGDLRAQQDKLLEAGERQFIIDLSAAEFMDSAGMAALVALYKRSRHSDGGAVVLVKPQNPAAYRILTLTRFDQVFTMAESVDEALNFF